MALEDWWASTARNAKDVAQYAVYPLTKMVAMMRFQDSHKANVVAGLSTTAFYTGLTWLFMGREMDGFDQIMRPAVAAELGKRADEVQFSDYYDSKNPLVQHRLQLFEKENSRYVVSALPMLPTIMEHASRKAAPGMRPAEKEMLDGETRFRDSLKPNASPLEHLMYGWGLWDNVVYAGVAALWLNETFGTEKSFTYQARKEMENNESLALKIGPNNIAGLYNRMRTDRGLPMVDSRADREKLWPIYEELARRANEPASPGRAEFGLPEMAYLMGLGKLDIFAKDTLGHEIRGADGNRVLDEQAYQRALEEIRKVDAIGLAGIAEEKRVARTRAPEPEVHDAPGFAQRVSRNWMTMQHESYQAAFGKTKKFQELISPRDPGEVPYTIA